MWIPTPIYERIPQFWLLLGLLFMSSGTYLGFEYALAFVYFGVGVFCIAWSIGLFIKRARHRIKPYPVRGLHIVPVTDKTQPLEISQEELAAAAELAGQLAKKQGD